MQKRVFDLIVGGVLLILLAPIMAVIAVAILIVDGRPIFFVGERMKSPTQHFMMVKFRTMRPDPVDFGATGAHKDFRVTRTGRTLRKLRLDELPQLINIIRGDMSFIGPRPPLRTYVERFPEIYGKVLRIKPGVSGLASIYYSKHENFMLQNCVSAEETEAVYTRNCIVRKMKLDLIYQRNQSLCFDILLMIRTIIPGLR